MLPSLLLAAVRPGAAFVAAPVFSVPQVPVLLRFVLAVAVGAACMRTSGLIVLADGVLSVSGVVIVAGEVLIGLALGFALQAGLSAALIAGELIGNAMGLGFAATVDPMSGHGTPAFGQMLSIVLMLLFLSVDGHLAFIAVLADSYRLLPVGGGIISAQAAAAIVALGGVMFVAAVTLALPVVTGVILVQLVMALLARTSPALNLFAVGLPAALLGGLVLLAFAMPVIGQAMVRIIVDTLDATAHVLRP